MDSVSVIVTTLLVLLGIVVLIAVLVVLWHFWQERHKRDTVNHDNERSLSLFSTARQSIIKSLAPCTSANGPDTMKCQCGSVRMKKVKCTYCDEPNVECIECQQRLWLCSCDCSESVNSQEPPRKSKQSRRSTRNSSNRNSEQIDELPRKSKRPSESKGRETRKDNHFVEEQSEESRAPRKYRLWSQESSELQKGFDYSDSEQGVEPPRMSNQSRRSTRKSTRRQSHNEKNQYLPSEDDKDSHGAVRRRVSCAEKETSEESLVPRKSNLSRRSTLKSTRRSSHNQGNKSMKSDDSKHPQSAWENMHDEEQVLSAMASSTPSVKASSRQSSGHGSKQNKRNSMRARPIDFQRKIHDAWEKMNAKEKKIVEDSINDQDDIADIDVHLVRETMRARPSEFRRKIHNAWESMHDEEQILSARASSGNMDKRETMRSRPGDFQRKIHEAWEKMNAKERMIVKDNMNDQDDVDVRVVRETMRARPSDFRRKIHTAWESMHDEEQVLSAKASSTPSIRASKTPSIKASSRHSSSHGSGYMDKRETMRSRPSDFRRKIHDAWESMNAKEKMIVKDTMNDPDDIEDIDVHLVRETMRARPSEFRRKIHNAWENMHDKDNTSVRTRSAKASTTPSVRGSNNPSIDSFVSPIGKEMEKHQSEINSMVESLRDSLGRSSNHSVSGDGKKQSIEDEGPKCAKCYLPRSCCDCKDGYHQLTDEVLQEGLVSPLGIFRDDHICSLEKQLKAVLDRNADLTKTLNQFAGSREQYKCEVAQMRRELDEVKKAEDKKAGKQQYVQPVIQQPSRPSTAEMENIVQDVLQNPCFNPCGPCYQPDVAKCYLGNGVLVPPSPSFNPCEYGAASGSSHTQSHSQSQQENHTVQQNQNWAESTVQQILNNNGLEPNGSSKTSTKTSSRHFKGSGVGNFGVMSPIPEDAVQKLDDCGQGMACYDQGQLMKCESPECEQLNRITSALADIVKSCKPRTKKGRPQKCGVCYQYACRCGSQRGKTAKTPSINSEADNFRDKHVQHLQKQLEISMKKNVELTDTLKGMKEDLTEVKSISKWRQRKSARDARVSSHARESSQRRSRDSSYDTSALSKVTSADIECERDISGRYRKWLRRWENRRFS